MNKIPVGTKTKKMIRKRSAGSTLCYGFFLKECEEVPINVSFSQVDNEALDGKTDLDVPGYVQKVTFGELTFFAYPLENSGEPHTPNKQLTSVFSNF